MIVNSGAQNGKFKIPTLRSVAMTAPYGHNVSHIVGNLGLTDMQVNHLVSFLESLTDE